MKGWIDICSDVNWEDYHGMWAKKQGSMWWVLQWNNLADAMGEAEAEQCGGQYECQVKCLDLSELDEDELASARQSCGPDEHEFEEMDDETKELAQVYACISYGHGAPLHTEQAKSYPLRVRAAARREAEELMSNKHRFEDASERQVNAIGNTAWEYGHGGVGRWVKQLRGEPKCPVTKRDPYWEIPNQQQKGND